MCQSLVFALAESVHFRAQANSGRSSKSLKKQFNIKHLYCLHSKIRRLINGIFLLISKFSVTKIGRFQFVALIQPEKRRQQIKFNKVLI